LEHYLALAPAVFDRVEESHRIYAAFRSWTGRQTLFRVDSPSIEALPLTAGHRGYLVLVNHSSANQSFTVNSILPIKSFRRIGPATSETLSAERRTWKMQLPPFDAAVIEWEQ
jgi:hypothetical protein